MFHYLLISLTLLLGGVNCTLCKPFDDQDAKQSKQESDKSVKPHEASEAEKKFQTIVTKWSRTLDSMSTFSVTLDCDWKHSGHGDEQSGKTEARVMVRMPDQINIEVSNPALNSIGYQAVSNGKSITRRFAMAKLHSITPTDRAIHDLQLDGLTIPALRSLGADFLINHARTRALLTQAVHVEDLGETKIDGQSVNQFRIGMTSGRRIEVSFVVGEIPVPIQWKTVDGIVVDEKSTLTNQINTRAKWDLKPNLSAEAFTLHIPPDSKLVDDLAASTIDAGIRHQIGKEAVPVTFMTIDDQPLKLEEQKGKSIVALLFWASWMTPTAEDLPSIKQFVEHYSQQGVIIWAVNVGESSVLASKVAKKLGFEGTIALDPQGESASKLGVNGIPAVLLIGKDGTIQAFHRGMHSETRAQVRKDLDQLISGKSLK